MAKQMRYFRGGPLGGTWQSVDDQVMNLTIPLIQYIPFPDWAYTDEAPRTVDRYEGTYRRQLVIEITGDNPLTTNKWQVMRWVGEDRDHWSTSNPAQLQGWIDHVLGPSLRTLGVMRQHGVDVEREFEWWFPPDFLQRSFVIAGVHVEYKDGLDRCGPILVHHNLPSGWRVADKPAGAPQPQHETTAQGGS